MSAFARHFDPNRFDFTRNQFDKENDTARPIFYRKKVLGASGELEEVEMVKVTSPGETLNVFGGKVTEEHKHRWPEQYERFKNGLSAADGIPLSEWPEVANDIDFIDQMRAFRINTVEDMAKLTDGGLRLFHGSMEYRKKAQVFLAEHNKRKDAEAKVSEMDDLRAQIAALKEQMAGQPPAPERKKPGPKPKVKLEAPAA